MGIEEVSGKGKGGGWGTAENRGIVGINTGSQQNAETTNPRNSGIEWHEQMKNKDVDHWNQNRRLSSSYLLFLQRGQGFYRPDSELDPTKPPLPEQTQFGAYFDPLPRHARPYPWPGTDLGDGTVRHRKPRVV